MAATSPVTVDTDWQIISATPRGTLTEQTVTAAYFKEDGSLTVLRTADHQAVYAIVTNLLVSIERKSAA